MTVESQGSKLQISNGASPEVFNNVGGLKSIGGPNGSATEIDTTDLDAEARTIQMGLPDEGQVSLGGNYLPDNDYQEDLRAARAARSLVRFRIKLSDSPATTFTFSAYVTEFSTDIAVDNVVQFSATLRITGAVVKGTA